MANYLRFPVAVLAAALAGVILGLGYAPISFWPAAIIGVSLIIWVTTNHIRTGRAVLLGYIAGLGFNAVTISWIGVLGIGVAIALIGFMSLWFALLGFALNRVANLPVAPVWWAVSWTTVELGYAMFPLGGFGWNRLAFTTVDQPLSGFLPVVGVTGVTFIVVLLGGLTLQLIRNFRQSRISGFIVFSLIAVGGLLRLVPIDNPSDTVNIGVVQGNVDGVEHGKVGYARSVLNNHLMETSALVAKVKNGWLKEPDFILWPENSTDIDPIQDSETRAKIVEAINFAGKPILIGAVMNGPGVNERQTVGLWWTKSGPSARYNKRNLVPFGEWIPFRQFLLPHFPELKKLGLQSIPGKFPGVIEVAAGKHKSLRIGDIICFELAFDQTVYDTLTHGAQVLTVQANNATYTGTGQTRQQLQIARARAIEARHEIVVATTNSFSGLILPTGATEGLTHEKTSASTSFKVPLRSGVTLGIRLHPWLGLVFGLMSILGLVLGSRRKLDQ